MCTYILVSIPDDKHFDQIIDIAKEQNLICDEIDNNSINEYLKQSVKQFITTKECDCSTELGLASFSTDNDNNYDKDIQNMVRKGWSQSKITRWLEDKNKIQKRKERTQPKPGNETRRWVTFISTILSSKIVSHINIILHEFTRYIDSERIPISKTIIVKNDKLSSDYLMKLEYDVLYKFVR